MREQAPRPSGNHPDTSGKVPIPALSGNYKLEIMRLIQLFILFKGFGRVLYLGTLLIELSTKYKVRCTKSWEVQPQYISSPFKFNPVFSRTEIFEVKKRPQRLDKPNTSLQPYFNIFPLYFNLISSFNNFTLLARVKPKLHFPLKFTHAIYNLRNQYPQISTSIDQYP
ncbi:hypothetical protein A33Q_3780 [Indibacter alkaliphilus LW1]|uniref:Uncharacterized protein n=1 Tax=Indibacter alkaliphilus (strain CCUG 57479 / KCTC 22604 / LW1) TaxID=1189612 RepID=S2D807_INDAL|nr:hypothetical protein A33Q_3780 [Indibacter alkaliphilus LW1]